MYSKVIEAKWVIINGETLPCKFSNDFREYLCLLRHNNHVGFDLKKPGLLTPKGNHSIEFMMAAQRNTIIDLGYTIVVPMMHIAGKVEEKVTVTFLPVLNTELAIPVWKAYAKANGMSHMAYLTPVWETVENNRDYIWSWMKITASTAVETFKPIKPESSLEEDLKELFSDLRKDEEMKRQCRCESTLAYCQGMLQRVLNAHGIRTPEQSNHS